MVHATISEANLGGGAWVVRLAEVTHAPHPLTPSLFLIYLKAGDVSISLASFEISNINPKRNFCRT